MCHGRRPFKKVQGNGFNPCRARVEIKKLSRHTIANGQNLSKARPACYADTVQLQGQDNRFTPAIDPQNKLHTTCAALTNTNDAAYLMPRTHHIW
jgi:hypothetical protein